MELINHLNVDESSGFYEPAFRQVLEDHLSFIKAAGTVQTLNVPPMVALRYQGDYYGLLNQLKVPTFLHWITMRVNGLISPADTIPDHPVVQTVDLSYIRRLYTTHRTQSKTKKVSLKCYLTLL